MKLDILKIDGSKSGDYKADQAIFGIEPNQAVVRQVVLAELTNLRQGTHATKNRALVNGGGRKPWRQKGRGVARAGTIRSPLWRGGGVTFGPKPHKHNHKLPKKLSKLARSSVLSSKVAEGKLMIIDDLTLSSNKTSEFVSILKKLDLGTAKITLVSTGYDKNLDLATRNLRNVYLVDAANVSAYDLIDCETLLIDKSSMIVLTEILSK